MTQCSSETEIDARGLKCPLPVLLARRALTRGAAAVVLIADDPASVLDVPVFCTREGYRLRGQTAQSDGWRFEIERGG